MESDPVLRRLHQHLRDLVTTPQTSVDDDLLALAAYDLPSRPSTVFTPELRQELVVQIYQVLPSLQQSPAQLVRLLSKLLDPVPLSAILSLDPPVDFVTGLALPATDYHALTLSLLERADEDSARRLATNHRAVFEELVVLWLCAEDGGVADIAGRTLIHLLAVGKELVWKRMFRDKDVYEQIFAICYPESDSPVPLSKTRKTIAQARLLEWLPRVGSLDWNAVLSSHHPDVEQSYGLKQGEGLLDFAAVRMVDFNDDVLMHRNLIMFFATLLSTHPESSSKRPSPALEFLDSRGIHTRSLALYTTPDSHDPVDITFLYAEAANYAAAFSSAHPRALLASPARKQILARLTTVFSSLSISLWSTPSRSPSADLHVLSSLPRAALVPDPSSPLTLVPSSSPNGDALKTLATIFHGPIDAPGNEITFPPTAPSAVDNEAIQQEMSLAHALFSNYVSTHPSFYKDIITHANRPSVPEAAIASLILLKSLITAPWDGVGAVMSPSARNVVVPYLLGLPNSSTTTVGSAGRDLQRIAETRHGVAKTLSEALIGRDEWRDVQVSLARRVGEGVWGSRVGGEAIATVGSAS